MPSDSPVCLLPPPSLTRRRVVGVALAVAPALLLGVRAQPAPVRQPTPAQMEGPFYPVEIPADADADLLSNGKLSYRAGQAVWLEGNVIDVAGRPVKGAQVEIWQCDHAGRYHHPGDGNRADPRFQGFGKSAVDDEGHYRFRTMRPVAYPGRTPHIHVKVRLGSRELLTTQLYVAGDPGNARDALWRRLDDNERAALTVPFTPGRDGWRASFQIIVAA